MRRVQKTLKSWKLCRQSTYKIKECLQSAGYCSLNWEFESVTIGSSFLLWNSGLKNQWKNWKCSRERHDVQPQVWTALFFSSILTKWSLRSSVVLSWKNPQVRFSPSVNSWTLKELSTGQVRGLFVRLLITLKLRYRRTQFSWESTSFEL